jgi:cytidylate kinase
MIKMQYENLYRLDIKDIKESQHHLILDTDKALELYEMLKEMLHKPNDCYCYPDSDMDRRD